MTTYTTKHSQLILWFKASTGMVCEKQVHETKRTKSKSQKMSKIKDSLVCQYQHKKGQSLTSSVSN